MSKPYTYNFNAQRMAQIYIEVLRLLQLKRMSRNPKVSARDIAQEIGCDHRAISAAISTQCGLNFHQLIAKIRSNEVALLLVNPKFSDYTVEEIGLHCGFASRQSYYNAFHRNYNMTPPTISPATPQEILRRCRR